LWTKSCATSRRSDEKYAELGRSSIPHERLLKAKLLQALYTIRSEVLLVEALDDNLLFRWFLDLNLLDPIWDNSNFSQSQHRLLQHRTAELVFARIVGLAREHGWVSDAHFTVHGTLIDAWASLKSFQAQDRHPVPHRRGCRQPQRGLPRRAAQQHDARKHPDGEARLLHKGQGKEAKLCFGLHALMENRHGLGVQAAVTSATGVTETAAATELLARPLDVAERPPQTVGADKGYHNSELVGFCRDHGIASHVAQIEDRKVTGLDGRTTRTLGYQASQKLRKRIEEIFGWCKEIGGLDGRANAAWTAWA
jgi:transposase